MNDIIKNHHPVRHVKSVKYAFSGIVHALLNEANFRVQVVIVSISLALGMHFKISNVEWGLLIISMGSLLAAELLNTVVEVFIDHLIQGYSDIVKIIKDLSAGFVLITAITSGVIFILVFGHRMPSLLTLEQKAYTKVSEKIIQQPNSNLTVPTFKPNEKKPAPVNDIIYYGESLNSYCTSSKDCTVLGCNNEICGSINDEIQSLCVFPDKSLPQDLGYQCDCVDQKCMWKI